MSCARYRTPHGTRSDSRVVQVAGPTIRMTEVAAGPHGCVPAEASGEPDVE